MELDVRVRVRSRGSPGTHFSQPLEDVRFSAPTLALHGVFGPGLLGVGSGFGLRSGQRRSTLIC